MQLRVGNERIFDENLDEEEVEAIAFAHPVSMLILEAIDELHRRRRRGLSQDDAVTITRSQRLFERYREAREADLAFELKKLKKLYGLEEQQNEVQSTRSLALREVQIAAQRIRHARVDENILDRILAGDLDLQKESPLTLYGYSVSHSRGLRRKERLELLFDFWSFGEVTSMFPEEYRAKWSSPGTKARKQRMVTHLDYLADTREAMDPHKYRAAVERWRHDSAAVSSFSKSTR